MIDELFAMMSCAIALGCSHLQTLHVDHVILGVSDLDTGIREFEAQTGIRAEPAGTHPDGTRNALVSLGATTYIEILAPTAAAQPPDPELAKLAHLSPVAFAVTAEDVPALRRRLAKAGLATTEPQTGTRTKPDGTTVRWSTFGLVGASDSPFFIHWESIHPATTSPHGCTLVGLEARDPKPPALRIASTTLATGPQSLVLTIRCGHRTVRFPAVH